MSIKKEVLLQYKNKKFNMWEFQHKGIINNVCCDGKEIFQLYMFYLPLKPARHANASFCLAIVCPQITYACILS